MSSYTHGSGLDQPYTELRRWISALRQQGRVIGALILRETRTRFGKSRLGYLWALAEPVVHVSLFAFLFSMLGRRPPVGDSEFLFLVTGFVPFFMFRDLGGHVMNAISANRALLHYVVVKNVDVIAARIVLEIATKIVVFAILLAGAGIYGLQWAPDRPMLLVEGFLALALLGAGLGTVNAVMSCALPIWAKLISWMNRILYLTSGVMYSVEHIPEVGQKILVWNPVMHGITWIRMGFYQGFNSTLLDKSYIISWGLTLLVVGLLLERILRRKIERE
jgi:capsular polysaccharide transport system permease protein